MSLLLCPFPDQVPLQWIFTRQDLLETPSVLSGCWDPTTERTERAKGIDKIIKVVDYLRVGRHVASTAAVFFHRFYMRRSLPVGKDRPESKAAYDMAATCVYLACKSEESPRKLKDVVEAVTGCFDKSRDGMRAFENKDYKRWAEKQPGQVYENQAHRWHKTILNNEDPLLETLCFDLIIEHPHMCLMESTSYLGVEKKVTQVAWTFLGDLILDPIYVLLDPPVLAAGAFLKACILRNKNPDDYEAEVGDEENVVETRNWLEVFDVDLEEAEDALAAIDESLLFLTEVFGSSKHMSSSTSSFATPRSQPKGFFGSQANSQSSSQNTPSHNSFIKKANSNGNNTPTSFSGGLNSPNPTSFSKPPPSSNPDNQSSLNTPSGLGNANGNGNVKTSNLSKEFPMANGEENLNEETVENPPGLTLPDFGHDQVDKKGDPSSSSNQIQLSSASLSNPFEEGETDLNLEQRPKSRRGTGDNGNLTQLASFSKLGSIRRSDEDVEKKEITDSEGLMNLDSAKLENHDATKDQDQAKGQGQEPEQEEEYTLKSPDLG